MVLRSWLLEGGCAEFKCCSLHPRASDKTSQSLSFLPCETGLIIAATPLHSPRVRTQTANPQGGLDTGLAQSN